MGQKRGNGGLELVSEETVGTCEAGEDAAGAWRATDRELEAAIEYKLSTDGPTAVEDILDILYAALNRRRSNIEPAH